VIDPAVAKSGGRVVKSTGDGILAEFPTAVEAVRCALDMRTEIPRYEEARRPECGGSGEALSLRKAINKPRRTGNNEQTASG
jgi:class 3 adenylate cyclase